MKNVAGHTRRNPNVNHEIKTDWWMVTTVCRLENPILLPAPQRPHTIHAEAEIWWQASENRNGFCLVHQTKHATPYKTETPFEWVGKPVPLRYRPATGALQGPAGFICNTHASQDNNTKSVEVKPHTLASSKQYKIHREASPICKQVGHGELVKSNKYTMCLE